MQQIPAEYRREIDRKQLKNPDAFDRVQLWTPGGERPGLVVLGDTGRGKTRAVFQRLATLHRENGTGFLALTADELKRQLIAAAWRENKGEVEEEDLAHRALRAAAGVSRATVEERCQSVEILFIDDLSQTKLSAYYAERLFALIEHRTSRGLPLIVTAQMDGTMLVRKLAGWEAQFIDTASCLVRRIRDKCQPINFGFDKSSE